MSSTSSVFFRLFVVILLLKFSSGNGAISTALVPEWVRGLESSLSRIVGKMDQFNLRLDHLDARVGRFQSSVQMRLEHIENGQTMTKLNTNLWGDHLNRIEEQLTRKFKNVETKFDQFVSSVESKLEGKLNAIQRDNRRHNEFITASFTSVTSSVEKLNDRVNLLTKEVNSTVVKLRSDLATCKNASVPATKNRNSANASEVLNLLYEVIVNGSSSSSTRLPWVSSNFYSNTSTGQLFSHKVTNMFEDILQRSSNLEVFLKESVSIANATRRDVHEGFRSVLASTNQQQQFHNSRNHHYNTGTSLGGSSQVASTDVISAVIVEALASVESMSTALGRRLTELSRSMEERFEMVSMSLNGFLESCLRIQEGAPLIEEHIAEVLEKILDTVDNSTRTATQMWLSAAAQVLQEKTQASQSQCPCDGTELPDESVTTNHPPDEEGPTEDPSRFDGSPSSTPTTHTTTLDLTRDLISRGNLSEDDKKSLWESLFLNQNVPD